MVKVLVSMSSFAFLLACSKDGKNMAQLSLTMSQSNSESLTVNQLEGGLNSTNTTPDSFKIKLIAVELVRSDNKYVAVWVNPDCSPSKQKIDLGEKNSSGKEQMAEFFNAESCSLSSIQTYLDIAQAASDVNSQLNSQSWPVPPGTYTQVSMRMCALGDTDEIRAGSLVYKGSTMDMEKSTLNRNCGVTGAPVSEIVISEGVNAKINLSYDRGTLLEINEMASGQTNDSLDENTKEESCYYPSGSSIFYCPKFGASTFVPTLSAE